MKKFVLIISLAISALFLLQIKSGRFTADDAVLMVSSGTSGKEVSKEVAVDKESVVWAAILRDEGDDFWSFAANSVDFTNIVVISENPNNMGRYLFAFKEYQNGFAYSSSGKSDFPFLNNSSNQIISDQAQKYFPNAKILSLSLKGGMLKADEIELFSKALKDYLKGNSLIVTMSDFSGIENKNVKDFHNKYTLEVLKNLESENIEKLDINNKKSVLALIDLANEFGLNYDKDSSGTAFTLRKVEKDSERRIFVLALGDMMMGRMVRNYMDRFGHDYPFLNIRDENNRFFKGSDLVFANLEGPIKGNGYISTTSMIFGFPEYVGPLLKNYGFNLLMIANNHALNQGASGRDTTIEALNAQEIGWCGNPSSEDPESVYYTNISGQSVAFICFDDVSRSINHQAANLLVNDVSNKVDLVFVSAHFGSEYKNTASNSAQVIPAHEWIDNGADFVIGHHPHVVQNFEIYNGKFIFYSLGNFIFDQYWSQNTQEQLGIGISIGKAGASVYLFPMVSEKSKPRLMNDTEYTKWIEKFIGYGNYSDEIKAQIRAGLIEIGN